MGIASVRMENIGELVKLLKCQERIWDEDLERPIRLCGDELKSPEGEEIRITLCDKCRKLCNLAMELEGRRAEGDFTRKIAPAVVFLATTGAIFWFDFVTKWVWG